MRKKKEKINYKNVKVEESDLSVTKIGELETAEKSPLFVLFLFAFLLLFIFFLPNIMNFIDQKKEQTVIGGKPDKPTIKEEEEEKKDTKYYDFNSNLTITINENIVLKNFKIENQNLTFEVSNNSDNRFPFNQYNYFLEIYDNNQKLLERIILKKETINKGETNKFYYPMKQETASNIKQMVLLDKKVTDYTNVTLTQNENKEEILVCSNEIETITYTFNNQKLTAINDTLNYPKSKLNYEENYTLWQSRINEYNSKNGAMATFVDTENGFAINAVLNLNLLNEKDLNNENYYSLNTEAKIVNYEMEARGFNCK